MARQDKPTLNVMVDIETVGTKPGCGILSIGACTFGVPEGTLKECFYIQISEFSLHDRDFIFEPATIDWWRKQPHEAFAEAFSGTVNIEQAMLAFRNFIETWMKTHNVLLWGNGSDFDVVILRAAFDKLGLEFTLPYYNHRCFRTLKNLFPNIKSEVAPVGLKHTAIADAINQANHAEAILKWLISNSSHRQE